MQLKNINIIFISPLPEFDYYPYSCFLNNKLCNIKIEEDLKRVFQIKKVLFEVAKENTNVFYLIPTKYLQLRVRFVCNVSKR